MLTSSSSRFSWSFRRLLSELIQTVPPSKFAASGNRNRKTPAPPITIMKPLTPAPANGPLQHLEEWEDFLKERYPAPAAAQTAFKAVDPEKKKEQFRNYEA